MIRKTVSAGESALDVNTQEEFARPLGSGVHVVPPSWADAVFVELRLAWARDVADVWPCAEAWRRHERETLRPGLTQTDRKLTSRRLLPTYT